MEIDFKECAYCASKPGSPTLCSACLHNRKTVHELLAKVKVAEAEAKRCGDAFNDLHETHVRVAVQRDEFRNKVGELAKKVTAAESRLAVMRTGTGSMMVFDELENWKARAETAEARVKQLEYGYDDLKRQRDLTFEMLKATEAERDRYRAALEEAFPHLTGGPAWSIIHEALGKK